MNPNNNTISVMGVTIQANEYPIGNLDLTMSYAVSWERQGNQNVLLNIQPNNNAEAAPAP